MCYHFESMKNRLLFIPIAAIVISMASCDFTDDAWREKYGTPELFLSQVGGEYHQETLLLGEETYDADFNYEIKDALLASGPFETRNNKDEGTGRCFTYRAYWQPATTGPNYCLMDVWDNGYLRITHKRSIGFKQYAYFSMNEEKATSLNDLVRANIERNKQIAEEAYQQALDDGKIEHFIAKMEEKTSYPVSYLDKNNKNGYQVYVFVDTGELFDLIKNATFTLTDVNFAGERILVFNGDYDENWSFVINSFGVPYVNYVYTDSLGRTEVVRITYSLPEEEQNAILAKALRLGLASY